MSTLEVVLVCVAYALGGFATGMRVTALLAWHFEGIRFTGDISKHKTPDVDLWVGAGILGFLVSLIWPLALLGFITKGKLLAPPQAIQLRRQQNKIKELEKELSL